VAPRRPIAVRGESKLCRWFRSQVQVCFTSVDGQVQPLDVALGHSVLQKLCDSNAKLGNISCLEYSVVSLISGQHPSQWCPKIVVV
jgi:hypothetical protein